MSDFTLYRPISTEAVTAGATASSATEAPAYTTGVIVYAKGEVHINFTGGTATTNDMPFNTGGGHYIAANEGMVLSLIRGAGESSDVGVWLTWVRRPY